MGKAKKLKVSRGDKMAPKVGLADAIEQEGIARMKDSKKIRFRNDAEEEVRLFFDY